MTRRPKVGEVWRSVRDLPFECVIDKPDADGRYVWQDFEGEYIVSNGSSLVPPTKPAPEWLDDDCWVYFIDAETWEIKPGLYVKDHGKINHRSVARARVDQSTFEWL